MADSLDKFWDISELVPVKKKISRPTRKITTTEISVAEKSESNTSKENLLNFSQNSQQKEEKQPKFETHENVSGLIKKAIVFDWKADYNYYNFFFKQAELYRETVGKECLHEHFFSYMPQYSQMNKKQLNWYFWWRHNVRNGIYLDTDHPYIMLYAMEIINLCTKETAKESLDSLIDLWTNYRDTYPQINGSIGEWVCDIALIFNHPIKFPDSRINGDMISAVSLPEIFYTFDFNDTSLLAKFLISYCNSYNYRKSKFYDDSTATLFDTHIVHAVERLLAEGEFGNLLFANSEKKASRIAYMGAICTYNAKKRIEVTYASPNLESDLKATISNVIKYCENMIRASVGVRSRLGIKCLSSTQKKILDSYFSSVLKKNIGGTLEKPDYEKLYDVKEDSFSLDIANEIELKSWEVTQKLVEAFEDKNENEYEYDMPVVPPVSTVSQERQDDSPLDKFYFRIGKYRNLFEMIKSEDYAGQLGFVKDNKIIFEAVVDEINDAAVELFDDILLEESEGGYKIIDDYKEIFK